MLWKIKEWDWSTQTMELTDIKLILLEPMRRSNKEKLLYNQLILIKTRIRSGHWNSNKILISSQKETCMNNKLSIINFFKQIIVIHHKQLLEMSSIVKFITIIQKILIIVCIICFIPTSIFVFAPSPHTFTATQISIYQLAYSQVFTPFIINYDVGRCNTQYANQTQPAVLLINQYCFNRANSQKFMVQSQFSDQDKCLGSFYQYDGFKFCAGYDIGNINNYFLNGSLGPTNFTHNNSYYPIFKVNPPLNNLSIQYYHYAPDNRMDKCKQLANQLTEQIQQKYSYYYYQSYKNSSRFLWYYTLPLLAILLVLIVMNEVTDKYNLRRFYLMACFCVNVALLALIIKGIINYTNIETFKDNLFLFSNCFIKEQRDTIYQMSKLQSGIGGVFIFFMGIVALLIFLSMVGHLVAKLIELKYYSVRDEPDDQGLQLSELKTSLRSRRIREQNSINSSKIRIVTKD